MTINTMTNNTAANMHCLGIQTLFGTIEPCSYNAHRVALIESGTSKEYGILPKGAGADLADYVTELMELTGTVSSEQKDEDNIIYTISVRAYKQREEPL